MQKMKTSNQKFEVFNVTEEGKERCPKALKLGQWSLQVESGGI